MIVAHLLILPDRDDAERLADELVEAGLSDVRVHREALAGEDDAEDVEWAIHVVAPPSWRERLEALAEAHDGWYDAHPG